MLGALRRAVGRMLPAPLKQALRRSLHLPAAPPPWQRLSPGLQAALRESYNTPGSELHLATCLRSLRHGAAVVGLPLQGRILEIGSYPHPGLALALLLSGAEQVYLNNLTPVTPRLPRSYAETVAALLGSFHDGPRALEDLVEPVADRPDEVQLRPGLLELLPEVPAERLPLPEGSLDTVFSITVLEHVDDLAAVLSHTCRLLRPGGWCCHDIDLRDHAHLDDAPLDFLRYSEEEYRARDPLSYRRRAPDYLRAFEAAGFSVASAGYCLPHRLSGGLTDNYTMAQRPFEATFPTDLGEITPWVSEDLRRSLHPDFRGYSLAELSVTGMQVVAVKP